MNGYGNEAMMVLQRARTLAGDPHFRGSAAEAVRKAAIELDADHHNAAFLLLSTRPRERMMKRIDSEPEGLQDRFRKRMLWDFDAACAKLLDAAKPSKRRTMGVPAAREAWNWVDGSLQQKRERWADLFGRVMAEKKGEKPPAPEDPS